MPTIFLSPSTQEYNQYVTGTGSEEYFRILLADAMEPLLFPTASVYPQRSPGHRVRSIRQSNAGSYDFHLALHSNASGPGSEGRSRGIVAFYYPGSANSQRAAGAVCIGPARDLSPAKSGDHPLHNHSCEVKRTKAPAVLLEIGYHDNAADAQWIAEHIESSPRPWYRL